MQKLAEICIKRPVFATMLILMLVVLGFDAYRKLGVDLFPKIDFPTVTITTTLRGAAPEEVESQVSKRIEEAVNTISGIDDLRSISSEGVSTVIVQFVLDKEPEVAAQEVRDKINRILNTLPKDTDPPVIEKIATDAAPVLNVVVASNRELRETTKLVDDKIKKSLESLTGVGEVKFVGERTRQIQIWLDGEKLNSYNLNIEQVRAAVASQNVEIPGGRVDQGNRELALRTMGRVEKPADFSRVTVATVNGSPVRVSDIGRVIDGVEEARSLARLDNTPAVVLEVRKQAGTNTLQVIKDVKDRIAEIQSNLPPDFKISYTRDQSRFISDSFKAVQEHLVLGGFCAAIVVFLFMRNWRSTLIAAVAIPTSIIATYSLMNVMGFTLNQITMLALVLMVGIVIDDAIVVLENIFRFAEEKGLSPVEAAKQGTRDIGLAVLATTLSLVVIFLPVAMMNGIVGKFMSSFGYTAAFAIMVSLLVSFTLTPMLCSRFLKIGGKDEEGKSTKDWFIFRWLDTAYRRLLLWSMSHRWAIVGISVVVFASTAPLFMAVGKDFLPKDDQSEFEVVVRMPAGSSLEGSDSVMRQLEGELRQLPGVKNMLTTLGADARKQVDRGSIIVELVSEDERKLDQLAIMTMARDRLKPYRDITTGVQYPSQIQGAGSTADLQFFLQGPDLAQLDVYAQQLKKKLAEIPGVRDVDSSYEGGKPELRVNINRDKAADLNVNVASIANAMRTLVGGDDQVTTYREGDDRYDVEIRVDKQFRDSPQALNRLYVPSVTLGNVPISNVATLQPATGPTQIERYNRQRQILLTANIVQGEQSLSNVLTTLDSTIKGMDMKPEYRYGTVGATKEFGRAAANFVIAFGLSIVFMYMILAAQFESFIDPVTILLSLPLSIPFALLSLLVTGQNYSIIYTSVGILVLFGIVKKNSILQIDHIKALRAEGVERLQAILRGCEDRLRPILMTTASLVAGMMPMALGSGAGSGSRRTVAIVVIGAQTMCLLLTLLVTPVAYSLFDDLAHAHFWARFGRLFRRATLRRAAAGFTGLCVLLIVGASTSKGATEQAPVPGGTTARDYPELQAPPRTGVGIVQRKLSLEDAVQMALANNIDIEIEKTNVDTSKQQVLAARGFFDPSFRWVPLLEDRNTPAGSVLQGAGGKLTEKFMSQNFYVRQKLPWNGMSLNLDFENQRTSSTNPFTSFSPYLSSRLAFSVIQPLLRGRKTDPDRAQIVISGKRADEADVDFQTRLINIITRVESAYWDLVAARQDVEVKEDSASWAREQLAINKRLVASGTLAPVELSASEAELQRRLDTWYSAIGTLTEVENILKTLIAPERTANIWGEELIPTEERSLEAANSDDLHTAVETALKNRTELRAINVRQQINDVEKGVNADLRKPQVNLVGQYSLNGLAGTLRPGDNPFSASTAQLYQQVNELSLRAGLTPLPGAALGSTPDFLIGGYGTALSSIFGGRYQSFQAGLQIDMNLRNRTADANYTSSLISEKRLKLERARAEQLIEAQVRNALQSIQTAHQRIAAAEASAQAAKEKLESEMRLYQTGESTNFLVLTRQNESADSRRRVVVARLELNKSIAGLEQALGTTLTRHNIHVK